LNPNKAALLDADTHIRVGFAPKFASADLVSSLLSLAPWNWTANLLIHRALQEVKIFD
jgi:hypothetical protein